MQDCNQGSWSWSETVSYQDGYLKLLSYQTETLARIQVPFCWFGEYIKGCSIQSCRSWQNVNLSWCYK